MDRFEKRDMTCGGHRRSAPAVPTGEKWLGQADFDLDRDEPDVYDAAENVQGPSVRTKAIVTSLLRSFDVHNAAPSDESWPSSTMSILIRASSGHFPFVAGLTLWLVLAALNPASGQSSTIGDAASADKEPVTASSSSCADRKSDHAGMPSLC